MGLIKDAIGSALGANQVNNGFNGPQIPFANRNKQHRQYDPNRLSPLPSSNSSIASNPRYSSRNYYDEREQYGPYDRRARSYSPPRPRNSEYDVRDQSYRRNSPINDPRDIGYGNQPSPYREDWSQTDAPPSYESQQEYAAYNPNQERRYGSSRQHRGSESPRSFEFRPLVLPQVAYGKEQPFIRGFSDELRGYGISERDFIEVVDAINVAIVPSPEAQIFQKGANIAGWFLPGAASLGLMAGQIGVGLGTAYGHVSMINRVLSKANLELFVPNGLEICIGRAKDVDNEVGIYSSGGQQRTTDARPEARVAAYGNLVAPITRLLPPQQQGGRNDPLAMLGGGLSKRENKKKMEKAQEEMAKGKTKEFDQLEGGLKWLMVRKATADARAYWQKTLQQSDAAVQQEQAKERASSGPGKR